MSNILESISVLCTQGKQVLSWLDSGLRSTTQSDALIALEAARKRQEQLVASLDNLQRQLAESPTLNRCTTDSIVAVCQFPEKAHEA